MTSAAEKWLPNKPGARHDLRPLVAAYTQAAGGDPEIAVLAWCAGMDPDELVEGLAAGRCSRDTLLALAGLRQSPSGWSS